MPSQAYTLDALLALLRSAGGFERGLLQIFVLRGDTCEHAQPCIAFIAQDVICFPVNITRFISPLVLCLNPGHILLDLLILEYM
jgi:hypothetical protein